jgi:hypothetical protein
MTRDDLRENIPDPESAPPVTVPTGVEAGVPGDQSTVASSQPHGRATADVRARAECALPGSGHAVDGRVAARPVVLLPWGVLLGPLLLGVGPNRGR